VPEQSLETRIAVLDAQVQSILRDFKGLERVFPSLRDSTDLEQKVAILETEIDYIKLRLEKKVEREQFWPVKTLVYGIAAIALLAVFGAIVEGAIPAGK